MFPNDFHRANFTIAGGQFILIENDQKQVYVLQQDLSTKIISLNYPANHLVVAGDQKVIALNKNPIEKEDGAYFQVSTIDVLTGKFSDRSVKLPRLKLLRAQSAPKAGENYLISIEGISRDLENVFCLYYQGETPKTPRLGTFNLKGGKETRSTADPALIRLTSGYAQYREMLYTQYLGGEGGVGACLIDMSGIRSRIDFKENSDLRAQKLLIDPFGKDFVLTTKSQMILLSSAGKILNRYTIPEDWVGQSFQTLLYVE